MSGLVLPTADSQLDYFDDNAFSEALLRTCKYRPDYRAIAFKGLEDARQLVMAFVRWYNEEHRHNSIRFVTPAEPHAGEDGPTPERRHALYQ